MFETEHPTVEHLLSLNGAFIQGLAGSGKSFLLRQLIKKAEELNFVVKKLSFTNTASRNSDGKTICKDLGISHITNKINPKRLKALTTKKTIFVIDEVSQIPSYVWNILQQVYTTFADLNKVSKEIYCFYSHSLGDFVVTWESVNHYNFTLPYFKSEEDADKFNEDCEADLRIVFGV